MCHQLQEISLTLSYYVVDINQLHLLSRQFIVFLPLKKNYKSHIHHQEEVHCKRILLQTYFQDSLVKTFRNL